jgi:hypothetical protein
MLIKVDRLMNENPFIAEPVQSYKIICFLSLTLVLGGVQQIGGPNFHQTYPAQSPKTISVWNVSFPKPMTGKYAGG